MQKITRVYHRHDLAVQAAHDVEAYGVPLADITLLSVTAAGGQHPGSAGVEAADSATGTIVAGPEARAAATPDESADVHANPEYGDATLLTVQIEDSELPEVRRILEQRLP